MYTLPAGTAVGTYIIKAVFSGGSNYVSSIDDTHDLTVSAPVTGLAKVGILTPSTPPQANSQAAPLDSPSVVVQPRSSKFKTHRSSLKSNRGPLALSHPAPREQLRTGLHLRVAEKPSHPLARLALALKERRAVTTAEA
jgi:hypothetical protein